MTAPTLHARVHITACHCRYSGQSGTVTAIVPDQRAPYRVDGLEPWGLWFTKDEIETIYEGEK